MPSQERASSDDREATSHRREPLHIENYGNASMPKDEKITKYITNGKVKPIEKLDNINQSYQHMLFPYVS